MFEADFRDQGVWAGEYVKPVVPSQVNSCNRNHKVIGFSVFFKGAWRRVINISQFQKDGTWLSQKQEELW